MHRARWVISGLIMLLIVGGWIFRIAHSDGDVTAAFHNSYGMAAGDCLKNPKDLTVVNCNDPAAMVTVLQQSSDANGTNCPTTANAIITEESQDGSRADSYWCVLDSRYTQNTTNS